MTTSWTFTRTLKERSCSPHQCRISISCYDSKELEQGIASFIEESLYALALTGMDLRALDGVTVARDGRRAACELQNLPDGIVPLEMSDQPETMELARTVAVNRGDEFRFHIVLRSGLGLMTLSSKSEEQALACGCIAHEAAHVEHEGHLYRTFRKFTDTHSNAAIAPGKPLSRRSMSGVNTPLADLQRSIDRKR